MQPSVHPVDVATRDPGPEPIVVSRHLLLTSQEAMSPRIWATLAGLSPTPVVVVPDDWSQPQHSGEPILLGLESCNASPPSADAGPDDDPEAAAIAFAFSQASARGVGLVVISVWQLPPETSHELRAAEHLDTRFATALEARVKPWQHRFPGVPVEVKSWPADAVPALLHTSVAAQLTVLGRTSGRPRLRGSLGGTALTMLAESRRPLAVVPAWTKEPP